ncbi:MAG: hypothetical protein ABR616_18105 [Dermatophilaceae bacterium]
MTFEEGLSRYAAATGLSEDHAFDHLGAMDEEELIAAVARAESLR